MSKKKIKEKAMDGTKFFNVFSGQWMDFVTELVTMTQLHHPDDPEQIMDVQMPITISGYLLGEDEERFYLGNTVDEITHSIRKEASVYESIGTPDLERKLHTQMNTNSDLN